MPDESASSAPEASDANLPALPAHDPGLARFQARPIIDRIEPRTLALIQNTIAPGCDHAEIGHFLELAVHLDLDPFAREVWCAKSKKGRLLIMVGRDGIRKIVQRNGLHMDGDVVRDHDDFTVVRTPDGNRTVAHSYGKPAERGAIVGAWAEVREGGPMGKPMGYFYAPLEEYMPGGDFDSPWRKQVGVMILAAAERQAGRQSTPMGGLLTEGEVEVADAVVNAHGTAATGGESFTRPLLPEPLGSLVRRANAVDPQQWRPQEIVARLPLPTDEDFDDHVTLIAGEVAKWLEEHEEEVTDAEVVPDTPAFGQDVEPALQQRWEADAEWRATVEPLIARYIDLEQALDLAVQMEEDENAEAIRGDLKEAEAALDAHEVPVGWFPETADTGAEV